MIKLDPSKLIELLSQQEKKSELFFILTDNPIFRRVVEDKNDKLFQTKTKVFTGIQSLESYVDYLATCGMFDTPKPCVIEFPEKLTQKIWNETKKNLSRLPNPPEASAYLFGPTKFKSIVKETDIPKNSFYTICYEPNDMDLPKCAFALLSRFENLSKKSLHDKQELVRLALESYSNDLTSCDMHFARMEQGKLTFSAALAGNPEVNGFHVAEAIALKDKHLVELRLNQCANCGEEAASVFMAIVYFLKQVVFVLAALEETKNLKAAFDLAKIPYPAQARLQKAVNNLNAKQLSAFFATAPNIEMEMRLQKKPHQYLSAEIISWL